MNNMKIREAIRKSRLKHYEVAELLGISEGTFCKKLRKELPIEDQERIVSIIEENGKG